MLYDDNHVQLDGPTSMAWSEDVPKRYEAYGWHASRVEDGNDLDEIEAAITAARADERPSIIAVRTHIGFGSPNKQDSQKAHGSPLGPDEVKLTKEAYGWDPDRTFYVPDEALAVFRGAVEAGEELVSEWKTRLQAYGGAFPDLGDALPAADGATARERLGRRPQDVRGRARRSPPATRRRTRSRRWPRPCRSCSAGRPTCRSRT